MNSSGAWFTFACNDFIGLMCERNKWYLLQGKILSLEVEKKVLCEVFTITSMLFVAVLIKWLLREKLSVPEYAEWGKPLESLTITKKKKTSISDYWWPPSFSTFYIFQLIPHLKLSFFPKYEVQIETRRRTNMCPNWSLTSTFISHEVEKTMR